MSESKSEPCCQQAAAATSIMGILAVIVAIAVGFALHQSGPPTSPAQPAAVAEK